MAHHEIDELSNLPLLFPSMQRLTWPCRNSQYPPTNSETLVADTNSRWNEASEGRRPCSAIYSSIIASWGGRAHAFYTEDVCWLRSSRWVIGGRPSPPPSETGRQVTHVSPLHGRCHGLSQGCCTHPALARPQAQQPAQPPAP